MAQASSSLNTNFCIYLCGESTYLTCKSRNTDCVPNKDFSKIMTEDEILSEFRAAEALLEGHFLLSSGRHSAYYLQCARLLMNPERASRVAVAIAQKLPRDIRSQIDVVLSPAMGGTIIGHEMGRALGVHALFVERPLETLERLLTNVTGN